MRVKGTVFDNPLLRLISFGLASGLFILASPFPKLSSVAVAAVGLIFVGRRTALWRSLLCAAFFFGFLGFSAVSGLRAVETSSPAPTNYYSQLTGNLLHGKLYLPWDPDQKLLALKDPYDPVQRNNINFSWDCSLYKGKYYLYWGVAPAISFIAPFYFLSSRYPLEMTIALWFAVWGAVFSFLLLMRILQSAQEKSATGFQKYMGALLVVFSMPYGALLRRPHIYEQALFSGHAYAMASLYCFYLFSERKVFTRANGFGNLGAGFLYGLALMSRPTYALLFPAFLLISYFTNSVQPRKQLKIFILSVFPLLGLMLAYNYFRFESPFEFGFFYQLNHIKMSEWGFSLKDTVFAVSGFLFQWPKFTPYFPYASFQRFGDGWLNYSHRYMNDEVIGLFFAAPFVIFLLFDQKRIWVNRLMKVPCTLLIVGFLLMLVSSTAGVNVRYEMEFLPFLILPATVWALCEWERTRSFVKKVILMVLFLYTIQAGFFSSFSLETQLFAQASPALWGQMKEWFQDEAPENPSTQLNLDYLLTGTACVPFPENPAAWLIPLQRRSP